MEQARQEQPENGSSQRFFGSHLRNRPLWKALEPVLTASEITIQECNLVDYDLHFIMTIDEQQQSRSLRVLLLSSSSLDTGKKQETVSRLEVFCHAMDEHHHSAIAFLLSEEAFCTASGKYSLDGLVGLQALMLETIKSLVPIIAIPDASSLLPHIHGYIGNISSIPISKCALSPDPMELLEFTTSSVTLTQHDINVLSDLFPSLKGLSQAIRTSEGRRLLEEYLGTDKALSIVGFWARNES